MKKLFNNSKRIHIAILLSVSVISIFCFVIPAFAEYIQSETEIITVTLGKTKMSLNVGETENLDINVNRIPRDNTIFVSPNGDDDASGSITDPLATIQAAIDSALPGDTVYLREGKYIGNNCFNTSGSEEGGYITVTAYNDEKAVVTSPSGVREGVGFRINGCDYIKIQNLTIADLYAKDVYGILMSGGEKNIYIENCEFTNIVTSDPGGKYRSGGSSNAIILFGEKNTAEESISNIYINNNIVHDNVNGWSENISVAGNCEYIYVTDNTVYNCTNIGIDFYGNAEYCSEKSLDQPRHCECVGNIVYNCNSFYASNAGIYVDGSRDILISDNETYNNFYGIEIGSEEWRPYYDDNSQVRNITVDGNNIHDNTKCGIRIGGWSNDESTGIVYNCDIINNSFHNNSKNSKSEIVLSKCDSIRFKNNIFDNGAAYEDVTYFDEGIDSDKITNISFE